MAVNKRKAGEQPETKSEEPVLASAEPAPQPPEVALAVAGSNDLTAKEGETGQAPQVQAILGVVLELGNPPNTVIFSTDDIANIKENGLELRAPPDVKLGTFKNLMQSAESQLGVMFPKTGDLPGPLSSVATKLEELEVCIHEAHIKIPGSKDKDTSTRYTFVMTAIDQGPDGLVKFGETLKVKGFMIGVTNEPKTST